MDAFSLTPLEKELLSSVAELDVRLTQLERGLKADSATAQAQRTSIGDKLRDLTVRLNSLEQSSGSLTSLQSSLHDFGTQYADLQRLFALHTQRFNAAIASCQAAHQMYQAQKAANEVLSSQVMKLSAALRMLPPP